MSNPKLPQTGRWMVDEFAEALGEESRTFQRKLKKHGIPHKIWGKKAFVLAEDFYRHAPTEGAEDAEEEGQR